MKFSELFTHLKNEGLIPKADAPDIYLRFWAKTTTSFDKRFRNFKAAGAIPKAAKPALYRMFQLGREGILTLLALAMFATTAFAETATWNPNPPEDNVTQYKVCWITNGVQNFARIAAPQTTYTFSAIPGLKYTMWVTAVNESGLESTNDTRIDYVRFLPPPPIDITARTFSSYSASLHTWTNYKLAWPPIDLKAYGASNYVLTVAQATNPPVMFTTTSSSYTIPSLALGDYTFWVTVDGAVGTSTPGLMYVQSSRPPGNPRGVIVAP